MGINPTDFTWHLEPGESFQTPEAVMVHTSKGIGEMSRIYHKLYNFNLVPGKYRTEKRPLLINSWEAAFFNFDTDKLVSFAERAREFGMDMLVMDDGWFGKRNNDQNSLGDWFVNESKLKGGLGELIDRVNALGLKFGIWYEPEMISPDSELFRAHPDWCVHVPNRKPCIGRHQYVLDMSRKDVRDNIFDQMYSVLSKYKIDYLNGTSTATFPTRAPLCSLRTGRASSSTASFSAHTSSWAGYATRSRICSLKTARAAAGASTPRCSHILSRSGRATTPTPSSV